MQATRLAIVGAGPAGLTLALYLKQHALELSSPLHVTLFEREGNHDQQDRSNPDRSYTIDITGHGVNAVLGVGDNLVARLDRELIPFRGIEAYPIRQTLPYEDHGWTGSRGDICAALLHELSANASTSSEVTVAIKWQAEVTSLDPDRGLLRYRPGDSSAELETDFDLIIGADGAGSFTRRSLEQAGSLSTRKSSIPNFSRILHLDDADASARLDPAMLHMFSLKPWAVGGAILDAPSEADSATGNAAELPKKFYVQMGYSNDRPFASKAEAAANLHRISFTVGSAGQQPASYHLNDFVSSEEIAGFAERPVYHTGRTVLVSNLAAGRCALLGDAGTAFPPVGQGVNAAMEAAVVFGRHLVAELTAAKGEDCPAAVAKAAKAYDDNWLPQAIACARIANTVVYGSSVSLARMLTQGLIAQLTGKELAPAQLAKDRSLSYVDAWRIGRRRNLIAVGIAALLFSAGLVLLLF